VAVIAAYPFDVGYAPSTEDAHVAAADATPHASLAGFGIDTETLFMQSTALNAAEAVSENQYATLAITADAGYELDLSSLTFGICRGGTSKVRGYLVRCSVDSYASNLIGGDLSTTYSWPTFYNANVDLTGAPFQNLAAITFRIYTYCDSGTAYTLHWVDFTVNGTVAATGGGTPGRIMRLNRRMW